MLTMLCRSASAKTEINGNQGVVNTRELGGLGETINKFEFEQALVKLSEIAHLCQRNGR